MRLYYLCNKEASGVLYRASLLAFRGTVVCAGGEPPTSQVQWWVNRLRRMCPAVSGSSRNRRIEQAIRKAGNRVVNAISSLPDCGHGRHRSRLWPDQNVANAVLFQSVLTIDVIQATVHTLPFEQGKHHAGVGDITRRDVE